MSIDQQAATAREICPLCGEETGQTPAPTFTYLGIVYTFCCPACRGRFVRTPEKYVALLAHEFDCSLDYPCPLSS